MTPADPLGRTDELDEELLEALVVRFEARGEHPMFSEMLRESAARSVAGRSGFSGTVTGIDLSPHLVAAAERLAAEEADAWASRLREDSDAGVFFGSSNYYSYVARSS